MSAQAEEASLSVMDVVKQVLSGFLVVAGIAAFYFFVDDVELLYRVIGLVLIVAIAVGVFATTLIGRSLWAFVLESKQEVRRVVWPTRDETTRTTLMVVLMVFVVGLLLWLLDMFLFWGIRSLTGQGD